MAGVDLSDGIAAIEAEMVDECVIRRGRPGTRDDALDPRTLALSGPVGAVLYVGRCLVGGGGGSGVEEVGHEQEQVETYRLLLPLATDAVFTRGDEVVVTAARWNRSMLGRVWRVLSETSTTVSVARKLQIEERR